LIKLLPCMLFEQYIRILALKMASPCREPALCNCIGALSFPMLLRSRITRPCTSIRAYHADSRPDQSADCQTVRDPNPWDLYVYIAAVFLSRLDHVTFSDQPQAADPRVRATEPRRCRAAAGEPATCSKAYTLCLKKQDTKLLPITSPNFNLFSKFFHW